MGRCVTEFYLESFNVCILDIASSHEANQETFDAVVTAPTHFEERQTLALRFPV